MKLVIILQNSVVSFSLDVKKIYQPEKYKLYLIANQFSVDIVKCNNQLQYYQKITVLDDFNTEHIISLIRDIVFFYDSYDIVTNSEETMPLCGKLRKYFDLDKNDYSRFYDKHIMKSYFINEYSAIIPKYQLFNPHEFNLKKETYLKALVKDLNFPLFTKPVQLYSSMNLSKINTYNDLCQWANSIRQDDYYEIDEFVDGTMYHCDSYIKNGEIVFTLVSQNSRPCYNFTVGEMKGTIVLPEEHADAVCLAAFTKEVLNQLGMPKSGVTHLEVIKTIDNKLYFIEIAHRSPGCLIPKMYKAHAGIDTIEAHFLLQIDPDYYPVREKNDFSAWACYPKIPGRIFALNTLPQSINSQCEITWNVKIGDVISSYSQSGRDYTGTIFMSHPSFEQLYEDFILTNNMNLCVISAFPSTKFD